jgi:hypothetical protein
MQAGTTVFEVGNPSNSVVSGTRGRFALDIPANKDVIVRVDGSTAGSDCLSTVRIFNLPAGPTSKQYFFDVITSKNLAAQLGGAGQTKSKALVMIKFDLPYQAAKGSETATLISPTATGHRYNTATGWEPGTTLFTGNNVFNTNHIFFVNVDPTAGTATFSIGPTSGSPTCVEALGATSVPTAAGTVSVVDVNCTN